MRRSLLALVGAGLSLALAACGSGTPSTTSSGPASSAAMENSAPADAGTLTVWVDETRIEAFKEVGEAYKAESGVSLDIVQKPSQDIKTDFIAQAPSGQGPDLIVGANDWIGTLASNGIIAPVELGDKAGAFSEPAAKAFTHGGQLMGVPYAVENIALVRNNKLAQETPATFDELVTQGTELTPDFPVLIQQGDKGDAYHLYPIQTSFGAPLFKTDDKGDYLLELGMKGAEGEAFASYVKKLADAKVLSASVGGDQAKQAFLDGRSAYIVTGPWWGSEFAKGGMDITVLPIPSAGGQDAAPFVGVQGVYLSAKSNNALLANQFLTYLAGEDAQKMLYEAGGRVPAVASVANNIDDPVLKGFGEAATKGHPLPSFPELEGIWPQWGGGELAIIDGSAEPVAGWQQMIGNIEEQITK
ncbi:extracellular solute-binding protein [Arachnia propionica]|uniref:Extracellular solute-binding protein n=1 Tax=Arachnia propionica TaxID=1750 RepID=A0A3P1T2V1_9ACTN|nr:extracellular solute-binding protein [Arachnia propionica]RRD03709.1 extracellular solute-binding protein [Arachnia propionica]